MHETARVSQDDIFSLVGAPWRSAGGSRIVVKTKRRETAVTEQRATRVFISYSHDSTEHAERVLKLANDLRRDSLDAIIDQYFTSPAEGWPTWMEAHIRDDDFIVMVCTETYYRRVVRKEAPGIGLGVAWEGSLIYNRIYREKCDLSRFVPVLLNGGSPDHIPDPVFGASYYLVDTPTGYESLLRRLFKRPKAEMPPIGDRPPQPPLPVQWRTRPPDQPRDQHRPLLTFIASANVTWVVSTLVLALVLVISLLLFIKDGDVISTGVGNVFKNIKGDINVTQ